MAIGEFIIFNFHLSLLSLTHTHTHTHTHTCKTQQSSNRQAYNKVKSNLQKVKDKASGNSGAFSAVFVG